MTGFSGTGYQTTTHKLKDQGSGKRHRNQGRVKSTTHEFWILLSASELHQLAPTPLVTQHHADPHCFLLQAGGGHVPGAGNIPHQPQPAGQCPVPGSSLCHPLLLPWADEQQPQRQQQTAGPKQLPRSGAMLEPNPAPRFIPSDGNGSAWS